MVSEKLLPCPFCGEEPWVEPENPQIEGDAWTRISCTDCDVAPSVEVYADGTHLAQAIAAWNTRAPADCKLADGDGKDCVLLDNHEGGCLSYDPKEVGVRLMSALGHVENCRAHGRITDAGFAAIRSALLIADRELSRLRAPADLRSALEAETIERCAKVAESERVEAEVTRHPEDIAYNTACRHIAAAIRALAPTKEPAA